MFFIAAVFVAVFVTSCASSFALAGDSSVNRHYFGEPVVDRPVSRGVPLEGIAVSSEDGARLIQIYNQDWIDYRVVVDQAEREIHLYYVDDPKGASGHLLPSGTKVYFASASRAWGMAGAGFSALRGVLPTGTRLFIRPEAANGLVGASVTACSGGDSKSVMVMEPRARTAGENPPGYDPAKHRDAGTIIDPDGPQTLIQPPLDHKDFPLRRRGGPAGGVLMSPPRLPELKNPGRFYHPADRAVDFGLAAVPGGTVFEIANNDWIPYRLNIDEGSATITVSRTGADDADGPILPPGGCVTIPSAPQVWTLKGEGDRRAAVPAGAVRVTVVSLIHDYRDGEFGLKVWVDDGRNDETVQLLPREKRDPAGWPPEVNPGDYADFRQPDTPLERPYFGPTTEDLLDDGIPARASITGEIRIGDTTGPIVTLANRDWVDYRVELKDGTANVLRADADAAGPDAILLPSGKKLVLPASAVSRIKGDAPKPCELKPGDAVEILPFREMASFGARIQMNGEKGIYPKLMTPWHRDASGIPAAMGGAPENVPE